MVLVRYFLITALLICTSIKGYTQLATLTNKVQATISIQDTIIKTKQRVVPNSFVIVGLDTGWYSFNYLANKISFKKPILKDSVVIIYRVFNVTLQQQATGLNYDSIRDRFTAKPIVINKSKTATSITGLSNNNGLQYNGSFGRNLSFGNNQSAVFNSQLNLQVSGFLADSIELSAAITDNNIPVQPDGTTRQLNEFDRVLVQFKKENWQLSVGDIDLRQPNFYFLNFYKRLQGASYEFKTKNSKASIAGAVAKGKFVRNVFQGLEGNQGPYRLQGNNNEFFLIILAGTERVFIDGEMMQRGEDQDYIINYNTGEIVFTQKRMITKDKRIQVEFEYADRNYLNAMFFGTYETKINKNVTVAVAAYSNTDSKNSTINQSLDVKQKQFLANIGDSVQNAFFSSAVIDTFSVNKILYAKAVNPTNPLLDSIYVFSTNPLQQLYSLSFVQVGANKGNYIPLYNAANGKVYEYIAPINGVPQGSFEPVTFLVTPKKQQIITTTVTATLNKKTIITTHIALSNYDANTFSTKDKNDNNGLAAKLTINHINSFNSKHNVQTEIGYEWVSQQYRPIERLRTVEFARDWGLELLPTFATEQVPKLQVALVNKKTNTTEFAVTADAYLRASEFRGIRSRWLIDKKNNQLFKYFIDVSVSSNDATLTKGGFTRVIAELAMPFNKAKSIEIGSNYLLEQNKQLHKFFDTLTPLSFAFENIGAFVRSNPTKENRWSINYFTRKDWLPQKNSLQKVDRSDNINFQLELLQNKKHQLKLNGTYRELTIINSLLTSVKPDKSLLGRAEYAINEWNGLVTGNVLYELGTGQEQRRDFSYLEVPPGRGEFAWNDYNNDGIPQLNEFEIALFPDQAKYIRIFTPTNEFIKTGYIQFNYSISLMPRALFGNRQNSKWAKFISRFMLSSALQTAQKNIASGSPFFNPFKGNITDTSLISTQQNQTHTISYNRFSSSWGVDVTNNNVFLKSLLTYGLESREQKEWIIRTRVNFKKQYTAEMINKFITTTLLTPAFANRNYQINSFTIEPRLTYTYLTKLRLQASYQFTQKNNSIEYGGEKATNNNIIAEVKWNTVNNTSLLFKTTLNNISYTGNVATTTAYLMLDALVPGKNYLWTIEFTKRFGNNLELNINYEGRKPGDTRIIHIGRAGVRAIL